MNWIQRHILVELTLNPARRYSEMKPDGIEGNLFLYHLEQMQKDKLIEKFDKKYQLSLKGRQLAGVISVDTGKIRQQPKIVVMLYARHQDGRYLLFRWRRQPWMNQISLPYGKTHFGASVSDMARRELAMKCSLEGNLSHIGDGYVLVSNENKPFSHMLVHVFEVTNIQGETNSTVPLGESFWAQLDDFDHSEFVPGFSELLNAIENLPRPFFVEINAKV